MKEQNTIPTMPSRDEYPMVQAMVAEKRKTSELPEDWTRESILENTAANWAYRKSAGKRSFDGLETRFPPDLRERIHMLSVQNLPGLLDALVESFFDKELRIGIPNEMEACASVIEGLQSALIEGHVEEFSEFARMYGRV